MDQDIIQAFKVRYRTKLRSARVDTMESASKFRE